MFCASDGFHDDSAGEAGGTQATGSGDGVKAGNQIRRYTKVQSGVIAGGGPFVGGIHVRGPFQ
jgi:hypothetical protein